MSESQGSSGTEPTTTPTTLSTSTGPTDPTAETTATSTTSASDTTGPDPSTSSSTTSTGDESTGPVVCNPGDTMGMGMVDKSFIWIPSQDQNDVAKVNTQTLVEVARYRVGPGNENPSRTAVSADGRFVVVNGRESGRSTMFAANVEDCVDANNNGMIDTSQGPNDVRPWGADECVRWTTVWPTAGGFTNGPRGVTWTPGTFDMNLCKYVNPKVWIGYNSANPAGGAHFVRVDGETGVLEETVVVPGWNGQGYSPYGGALDPEFRPWFGGLRGEFLRINSDQNPATVDRWTPDFSVQTYGFTVDKDGDPWFAGCAGPITHFNPDTQTYTAVPGTNTGNCYRGIAADDNYVWAASNGGCGLMQVDRVTKTMVQFHVPQPCSTAIGVSIDLEKFVWLVDQEGWAWKIDPDNVPAMQQVMVPGSHYVYSDMTGGQVLSILPQ
jgi:hypothetical protein